MTTAILSKATEADAAAARNVLFDLDGTLLNSSPGIIGGFSYALRHLGYPAEKEERLRSIIGAPLSDCFRQLIPGISEEELREALRLYRLYYAERGEREAEIYPGVMTMLARLRELRCRLFVATAKPQPIAAAMLRYFRLAAFFEAIVGSRLDGSLIHKSAIIELTMRQAALDPGRSILIGDRHHDMHGAREQKIGSIGVTYGFGAAEELRAAGAIMLCDHASDIPCMVSNYPEQI